MKHGWPDSYLDDIRDMLAAHADAAARDPADAALVAASADDVRDAVSRYEEKLLATLGVSSPLRFLAPPASVQPPSQAERDPDASSVLITIAYRIDINVDDFAYQIQLRYGDEEPQSLASAIQEFVENEMIKLPPPSIARVSSLSVDVEFDKDNSMGQHPLQ